MGLDTSEVEHLGSLADRIGSSMGVQLDHRDSFQVEDLEAFIAVGSSDKSGRKSI